MTPELRHWADTVFIVLIAAAALYYAALLIHAAAQKDEFGRDARGCLFAQLGYYAVVIAVALPFLAYSRCRSNRIAALAEPTAPRTVYVCTGPAATRYHLTDTCWALRQCSADIVSIPLDSAAEYGYTSLCRLCRKYQK